MRLMLRAILLTSLFFVPLLGATGNFGYEQIKVLFFMVLTSLTGFIWLLTKQKIKWDLIRIASLTFILVLFIASAFGPDIGSSLFGREPYFQGLILYAYLFLFSLLVSALAIKLEHAAMILAGSATIVSLLAIQDWVLLNLFYQQIPAYAGRVVSTFGQPNFYAGFLLLILPFCYYLFKAPNKKLSYFGLISGLISFVGIFVSYSRSAILLALLLLILGLIDQLRMKLKIGLVVLGIVLISIVIALKLSSGIVGNEISRPLQINNPDLTRESVEKRAYIWPLGLKIVLQKPFTGYGLENITDAFSVYFANNKHSLFEANQKVSPIFISLKELNIDRSHNYFLDLLLFSGILGALGWLGLIVILFKNLRHKHYDRQKNVLLLSLITYLVWVQFQNQSIVQLIYFWLLAGLIDSEEAAY